MRSEKTSRWGGLAITALAIACLSMAQPAASECLSPSAEAGATATTVYRCPEGAEPDAQQPSAAKQPLGTQEKSTVVERGSADVPWFEPPAKPDPIKTVNTPQKTISKPPSETGQAAAPKTKAATIKPTEAAANKDEAAVAAPEPEQPKITKKAAAKKKVIAKKRKIKKSKIAKSKKPKTKAKTDTVEPTTAKIESKPPDEKTIVWTKKDMPLGSRIVNWLGF